VLKLKFRKLHATVVNNVNPASIINILFQEAVIGPDDMRALVKIRDDPQQQCTELLALLHTSDNPQAFIQLYAAVSQEPQLRWLVERIDDYTDQSVVDLLQQMDISKTTGECRLSTALNLIASHLATLCSYGKMCSRQTQGIGELYPISRSTRTRPPTGQRSKFLDSQLIIPHTVYYLTTSAFHCHMKTKIHL